MTSESTGTRLGASTSMELPVGSTTGYDPTQPQKSSSEGECWPPGSPALYWGPPHFLTLPLELRQEILGLCLIGPSLEERFNNAETLLYTCKQLCVEMEDVLWTRYRYITTELGDFNRDGEDSVVNVLSEPVPRHCKRGYGWGRLQQMLEKLQLLDLLVGQYNLHVVIVEESSDEWVETWRARQGDLPRIPILDGDGDETGRCRGERINEERVNMHHDMKIMELWRIGPM